MIFQASRDSFKTAQFHAKCNNIPNTLTIVETSSGKIIGGFTPCEWNNSKNYFGSDKSRESFVFQFNNNDKFTLKTNQTTNVKAITNHPNWGPVFGEGDIYISHDANINSYSFANIGVNY